ncbi:hypothetical protein Dimus_036377 [Dionaea muscipula]
MEFCWDGKQVIHRGDATLSPHQISFHQLQALVHSDVVHDIFELYSLSLSPLAPTDAVKPLCFPPDLSPAIAPIYSLPLETFNHNPVQQPLAICATRQVLLHGS